MSKKRPGRKTISEYKRMTPKPTKQRKNYDKWMHHRIGERGFHVETSCGKELFKCHCTGSLNAVDCPRCIEKLKENNWYCETCGFIDDSHVTNDERCDICGGKV